MFEGRIPPTEIDYQKMSLASRKNRREKAILLAKKKRWAIIKKNRGLPSN